MAYSLSEASSRQILSSFSFQMFPTSDKVHCWIFFKFFLNEEPKKGRQFVGDGRIHDVVVKLSTIIVVRWLGDMGDGCNAMSKSNKQGTKQIR